MEGFASISQEYSCMLGRPFLPWFYQLALVYPYGDDILCWLSSEYECLEDEVLRNKLEKG